MLVLFAKTKYFCTVFTPPIAIASLAVRIFSSIFRNLCLETLDFHLVRVNSQGIAYMYVSVCVHGTRFCMNPALSPSSSVLHTENGIIDNRGGGITNATLHSVANACHGHVRLAYVRV